MVKVDAPVERVAYATVAALVGLAGSGFFWLPNGAAQAWPLYLCALLLPWYLPRSPNYRVPRGGALLALAVLVWMTLSVAWSQASIAERGSRVATGLLLLAWMAAFDYLSRRRGFWLWAWTALIAVEVAAAVAALIALALGELNLPGGRFVGLMRMSNPAVAGALWGQGVVAAAILAWHGRRARPAYLLAALTLLAATLATELRSAIVGLAAAGALLVLGAARARLASALTVALLVALGGLALWIVAPDAPGHPRALAGNPRWAIWQTTIAGLDTWGWWFGHGAATDQRVFLPDGRVFDHAHGIWVATLAHTGLIGLALLIAAVATGLRGCLRRLDLESRLALAGLTYLTAFGLFDGGLPFVRIDHSWLLLWFPLAAAIGACRAGGKPVPSGPRRVAR